MSAALKRGRASVRAEARPIGLEKFIHKVQLPRDYVEVLAR
jgi:hypothetical protein